MANRFILTYSFLALFLCAAAQAELTVPVEALQYHLRLGTSIHRTSTVALEWNHGRRIEFDVPPAAESDHDTGANCRYRLFEGDSLTASGNFEMKFPAGRPAVSLILRVSPDGACVEAGTDHCETTVTVSFDRFCPGAINFAKPEGCEVLRNELFLWDLPPGRKSRFDTIEALTAYLENSTDPLEGVWEYFDRNTDPALAEPGGRYTLAVVADLAGGYDIVYLSGSERGSRPWKPLEIKGHLQPSGFSGNYHLEWTDADDRETGAEAYAAADLSRGLLTFHFPLLGSELRFRLRGI